ncbi:zinc ABC transporter substrate-binding protein [Rhodobacter ferrooxidans]|uniref:High-affinity zinc uptake system protein ZnuA n=1 Tax=Rhodobacter ferrooxidans TaxID=371731 RepID=C8S170_9RHOB|nr:zinc ABC transporter substrate-binding protein [Rhodobacter sp. SW2]EEW25268.1 periplasmic solute binding protein [Rhodobacter sp. SW2]
MRYTISFVLASLLASPALAEVPRVVTDFGPVDSLVAQVMGDLGAPQALLAAGGDPHDFQLRPSQAQALAKADLVFWVGPELMPSLDRALASLGAGARVVSLLHQGGGVTRNFAEGGIDPHAWLSPANAEAWLATIAAALAQQDPQNAAVYAANAAAAQMAVQALDAELAAQLAPVRGKPFVVFHDALGYFADQYGLTVAGAIELGDASAPGAEQLSEISALMKDAGVICAFPEAGRDPKYLEIVLEGSAVRLGPPQDIEGMTLQPGPGLYAEMLRSISRGLTDCLIEN